MLVEMIVDREEMRVPQELVLRMIGIRYTNINASKNVVHGCPPLLSGSLWVLVYVSVVVASGDVIQ